jgi:hypothetical protein
MSTPSSPASQLRREYQEAARALLQRAAGFPEPAMRLHALVSHLCTVGALEGMWTLETVLHGALCQDPQALLAYEALVDPEPAARHLGRERLATMMSAAEDEDCTLALQWLFGAQGAQSEEAAVLVRTLDPERLVAWGLREMPLGDRRALARRAALDTLQKLALDPDPGVIANLLNNARLTEPVVLTICSRRPTMPAVLAAVVRAPRWFRRYRIKLALAHNPYTPLALGLNILLYLSTRDLHAICIDETLAQTLRLGAQRIIELQTARAGYDA